MPKTKGVVRLMLPHLLSTLALVALALLLGATLYESVVMAPNYERDIPSSVDAARQFLKRTTPAHFFRVLSPVTQVLLLASIVASWSQETARWGVVTALGLLLLLDAITFSFHYPRLAVMFKGPMPEDHERLRRAAREWAVGNWVRALLLLIAFLSTLRAVVVLAAPRLT
ncbi:MAG: hypothetical protein U0132_17930 [Gemmatimonadaceae bacterium]